MCLKCVIVKPRKMRQPRPPRGCRAIGKKNIHNGINSVKLITAYTARTIQLQACKFTIKRAHEREVKISMSMKKHFNLSTKTIALIQFHSITFLFAAVGITQSKQHIMTPLVEPDLQRGVFCNPLLPRKYQFGFNSNKRHNFTPTSSVANSSEQTSIPQQKSKVTPMSKTTLCRGRTRNAPTILNSALMETISFTFLSLYPCTDRTAVRLCNQHTIQEKKKISQRKYVAWNLEPWMTLTAKHRAVWNAWKFNSQAMNIFIHAAGVYTAQQYITQTGDYLSHWRDSNPRDHSLRPYPEHFQDVFLLRNLSGAIWEGRGGGERLIT
jgi:hypothetical protein